MIDELLKIGFLTGSRAFGTHKFDSDYDIVYAIQDSEKIDSIIHGKERNNSLYFSGYHVNHKGKLINLIPVHPHEFLPWYLATKAMKETLIISNIIDPIKKYAIFQGIVSLYKGTVEELNNMNEYNILKEKILKMEENYEL